jgi:hypothetical protein
VFQYLEVRQSSGIKEYCTLCGLNIMFFFKVPSAGGIVDLDHDGKSLKKPRPKNFKCEVCNKEFNDKSIKNLHMGKHEDKKIKKNIHLKCNSQSSPFIKQALQRMREMKLKKNMENNKSEQCQVIEYNNFRV